jgi:hypothetical protein
MKRRNPTWGCPRIARQIALAFGVDIDKDNVRRILGKYYGLAPGCCGPSWLTFLGQAKDSLWSIDLFRCESLSLRTHWVTYIRFSCSARLSRALEGKWARLPRREAAFLGGPERGSQNREGARAKQKLRRRRAPQKPRSSAETNGQDRKRDRTDHHLAGCSRQRNAVIQNHPRYASAVLEVNGGFPERQ